MNNYSKNSYKNLVLSLTFVSLLAVFISLYNRQNVFVFDSFSNFFLMPIQKLFIYTEYSFYDFFHSFENVSMLRNENEILCAEIENKNIEISKIQSLMFENEDLKKMLNIHEVFPKLDIEIAKIVSRSAGNFCNMVTINKGSTSSIKVNNTITTVNNQLIGRVCEVGTKWAKVMTIFDEKNAVGARVMRSLELGVIECETLINEKICKMTAISTLTDIMVGDYIETSGGGGIYPEGILIGTVLEIKKNPGSIAETAIIKPLANFDNLKNVFIIKNSP